jgi:hypothetical protein
MATTTTDLIRKGVSNFGGKFVAGTITYDGVEYSYASKWNRDEDADDFLNAFSAHITKSARSLDSKCLMLFFSVK